MIPEWNISEHWLSAASGPDTRVLHAQRGDTLISAWTVAELARALRQSQSA
jgi:hypothetical protein